MTSAQQSGSAAGLVRGPVGVWAELIGQHRSVEELQRAVAGEAHAMSHAWLITGPPGSGRSNAGRAFAAGLQCERGGCGECTACRTSLTGAHPDVTLVRTEQLLEGRTLYLFEKDTGKRSQCSGACAQAWPPLTTRGKPAAKGSAKASLLSTSARSGGPKQVTYDGHPLYRFAPDTAAGQTKGQGVDGFGALWWVVAPSGTAIESDPAPSGY